MKEARKQEQEAGSRKQEAGARAEAEARSGTRERHRTPTSKSCRGSRSKRTRQLIEQDNELDVWR